MEVALYKLTLKKKDKQAEKAAQAILDSKDRLEGTSELIWELIQHGYAKSYLNERIMWLGYQFAKQGIEVEWSKC